MLLAIGMAVGALAMQTLDAHEIVMSNYGERRGTLIVFMSSRSPSMQEAVEPLLRVHAKYRRQEVLLVGVCFNDAESPEEIKAFCQRNDLNFPVYRDHAGEIAKRFGARFTPGVFLIDEKGILRYRGGVLGEGAADDLDATIQHLLAHEAFPRTEFAAAGTPIAEVGAKGSEEDPVEPVVFSSEAVFDKIPWAPDHHCSTLAEAPNGDLLCVWYGGSFECADDQVLFFARRKKGESDWSKPEVLTRGLFLHPPGNAVVFRANASRMMVLYDRMDEERPIRNGRWRKSQLVFKQSDDNGCTWTDDAELHLAAGGIRNAPFTLQSGELLLPMSSPKPCFLISRNGAATWEISGAMDRGGQPTAVQRSDGSLLCLLRNEGFILQSESHDLGKTWTPAQPSVLRCPGAGIAMRRLRNGHFVVVFNDSAEQRTPLSVALSTDEGATWRAPASLEANPGEYSYPCVIETSDGMIHVTYTFLRKVIKHAEFNERWLALLAKPQ